MLGRAQRRVVRQELRFVALFKDRAEERRGVGKGVRCFVLRHTIYEKPNGSLVQSKNHLSGAEFALIQWDGGA